MFGVGKRKHQPSVQLDGMTATNDHDPAEKGRVLRVRAMRNIQEIMERDEFAGTIAWADGGGLSIYDAETGQTFSLSLIQIWAAFRIGLGWKPEGGWPGKDQG